jgi:hypothetical protein
MSKKSWENNIICLIPTWLTATHALGAFRNFRKYYPDIPVVFVDDEYSEDAVNKFYRTYIGGLAEKIFDPDSTKLIGLPNSAYIRVPHEGFETEGHGNAITKAMPLIRHKWIFHLSSDVRIMKEGILEYMFEKVTNKVCGIGGEHKSREGWDNVAKEACIYRGDLYHKYELHFEGGGKKWGGHVDCGTIMFRDLVKKGYKMKYCDPMQYATHIRPSSPDWETL